MSKPAFTRTDADTRRRALIDATAAVLARDGAASVRAVAQQAGVSPGLVTHHFGSMDALVAATYIHVTDTVARALAEAVAQAGDDPRARLLAYITGSFAPPIADPDLLATWIAFWSLTRSNPNIARLHHAQYADYRAELETLLAACDVPGDRRAAAIGLTALVDGLWLELCLSPDLFSAGEAQAIAERQLAAYFDNARYSDR